MSEGRGGSTIKTTASGQRFLHKQDGSVIQIKSKKGGAKL